MHWRSHFFLALVVTLSGCTDKRDFPEVVPLSSLSQTDFASCMEAEIDVTRNAVYAPTLCYAWSMISDHFESGIEIPDSFPELIELHQSESFQNSLDSSELQTSIYVDDYEVRARASFEKTLDFEHEFERNYSSIKFNGVAVETFGCAGYSDPESHQVKVLYYAGADDYAIALHPKDGEHVFILCKSAILNESSLQGMYAAFEAHLQTQLEAKNDRNDWRYDFLGMDHFSVPYIKFNIAHDYPELTGNKFLPGDDQLWQVAEVFQRTAFLLDEKGAKVESEAYAATEAAEEPMEEIELPEPKHLVFDGPFMLVLTHKTEPNPYLALWIANEELLVPSSSK